MPKVPVNYANTIIYKLCCNDVSISDIYVGHTTNFIERRRQHKNTCCNDTNIHHYLFISLCVKREVGTTGL
jgi:predicted GIY-YIG superfamily endonuclease